jgi:hypothetical protein
MVGEDNFFTLVLGKNHRIKIIASSVPEKIRRLLGLSRPLASSPQRRVAMTALAAEISFLGAAAHVLLLLP